MTVQGSNSSADRALFLPQEGHCLASARCFIAATVATLLAFMVSIVAGHSLFSPLSISPGAKQAMKTGAIRRGTMGSRRKIGYQSGMSEPTTTLWRPVGPAELDLIRQANMETFPPRLPEQPIFYPVLSEEYATKIARDWNVPASGSGFVTRFEVKTSYLNQHQVHEAGGRSNLEYWIPAEELFAFNDAIVGKIVVVQKFYRGENLG
jgi:hypothetical protein